MSGPKEKYENSPAYPDDDYWHNVPENSYSRMLDSQVQQDEQPYGYSYGEPPADTNDFNQQHLESKTEYGRKRGRAI